MNYEKLIYFSLNYTIFKVAYFKFVIQINNTNYNVFRGVIKINITIDSLNINYIKKGEGENVLIIPGWGTTIDVYMPLIDYISSYATVYCLDMPGFGKSQEPTESFNVDKYVDFIQKFIKSQNITKLNLIGHSNGGRIIIKLMNKKDLDFSVDKIVLIGSAGIVHKKSSTQKFKIKTYKTCKHILNLKPIKLLFPNLLTKLQNHFGSTDYKNASPVMRETLVKLVNEDLTKYLPNINVPTLLIWGENDTQTPISDAKIIENLIPDSALINVKGCSHYVFLENPSYVNIVINNFFSGGAK